MVPKANVKSLHPNPDLRHLKLQAKTLLKAARGGDKRSLERMAYYQSGDLVKPSLAQAQLAIAREYGFDSWTKLKLHVENATKTFAEKLETFLSEGWSWGDSRRAVELLNNEPALGEANIYAACVAANYQTVGKMLQAESQLANKKGGPKKWPPLLYATWSCYLPKRQDDSIKVIQLLLENGADPNASWKNKEYNVKESALYGCVEANQERAAKALLEAGADPNDGESLYHACEKGNLAMLETLGKHGLNERDVSYCVKHAMDFRWDEGIQWFLDQGADPNAVHPAANETSLHWAIKRNCSMHTIRALLEAGANPKARTKHGKSAFLGIKGWTPLEFALRLGRKDVAELLKKHGAEEPQLDPLDQFVVACANGDRGRAEDLLSQHVDLTKRLDADDRRMIAHVAQAESWDGVKLMVQMGWSPEADGGWMETTPLSWALCYGSAEMVDFLLDSGASPTKDVGGYFGTPLNTVLRCRWKKGDHAAALKRLLQEEIPVSENLIPTGDSGLDTILQEHLSQL